MQPDPTTKTTADANPVTDRVPVRFKLVERNGTYVSCPSVLGLFGKSATHESQSGPDHPAVVAIRQLRNNQPLNQAESEFARSFIAAWLDPEKASNSEGVSELIVSSTDVPGSIETLDRIGAFGRTVKNVAALGLTVGGTLLMLDSMFGALDGVFGLPSAGTLAGSIVGDFKEELGESLVGLPDEIRNSLDEQYGKPGNPRPVDSFQIEPVVSFLRYSQMLPVVEQIDALPEYKQKLLGGAKQRLFSAFLIASRQIEGMALNGAAACSAVAGAHAAMALGVTELHNKEPMLDWLEKEIAALGDEERREEATKTLTALKKNAGKEAEELARRLSRQTNASVGAELADWAAFPVSGTFQFLALVSDGLAAVGKDTVVALPFRALATGFRQGAKVANVTPAVVGTVLSAGVTVEEAMRSGVSSAVEIVKDARDMASRAGSWIADGITSLGRGRNKDEQSQESEPPEAEPDKPPT